MRILQLSETLAAGGAETFVVRLANALAEAGHEVMLAVTIPNIHPALEGAISTKVSVKIGPAGWRWWWRLEKLARMVGLRARPLHHVQKRWLKRQLREFRPDVIHSHLLKSDLLAMDARRSVPGTGHVLTVHGDYTMFLDGLADPFLLDVESRIAAVAHSADAIVAVAEEHLDLFRNRFCVERERLHLIYNGYDTPNANGPTRGHLGLPEDKFLFGMVARGIEAKGWREAITAFAALGREDCALVLVGEGPFLDELRAEGHADNIIFAGFASRPIDWIRHFDCGLLPSFYRAESLPTVIIEYLACGKPVIATDIGEVAAMLRSNDGSLAGQLVPQRAVKPLTDAMMRIIVGDDLRRKQSEAASGAFAKFAMNTCRVSYERLFTDAANRSSIKSRH